MKQYKVAGILMLSLTILSIGHAGSVIREFNFPKYNLNIERAGEYSIIHLNGCDAYTQEIGNPMLPIASVNLLIPATAEITNIEILDVQQNELSGDYVIYPVQEPKPISYQGAVSRVEPNQAVYNSAKLYPSNISEIVPSGCKSGFRIGSVLLYPVQYLPNDKKLMLNEKITVRIDYEENRYEPVMLTESQKELFKYDVQSLVVNPEDINVFAPPIRVSEPTNIDYVILTSTALEARFTPVLNWLKKTGFWAETRTTSWVSANYAGRDLQEKIRNFVRDYFTNYGMKYILLAGDHSIIPSRQARAVVGSYTGDIPCDLYYLDLQWSWDGNNDNIFGEASVDTVDLYYDLYGGRWPVETTAELDTLIRKFFTYVKSPNIGYQKRMLLPAATLWSGYNHLQSQDSIANMSPAGWTDRVIDMASDDAWRYATRDSLNTGFGYTHLVGHGNDNGVYIGGPMYYYTDPATQTNYDKLTIANSIACYPGNFETNDCLAEKMMLARGSAIAVMMNSRYGWGQPPSLGPSERQDMRFFDYLLNKDSVRIARCHQASKEAYRSYAYSQQVWRWCHYELNLFGEPQMMMWKDNPTTMTVSFANPIYVGSQTFSVNVSSGGSPIQSAIVSLWKGSEVFARGVTNSSGVASIAINPVTTGYMYVTVTAKNRLPYEDSTLVTSAGANDVGVTTILAPTGNVDVGSISTPQCVVFNYGTSAENYTVRMKIGSLYNQTISVTNHQPATSQTISFPDWTASQLGMHAVSCSTELASDINPTNDKQIGSVFVVNKDVGVTKIINPTGAYYENTVITPACSVYNYGNTAMTFSVRMKIGGFYNQTAAVNNLNANSRAYVIFPNWPATQIGTHAVSCSTELGSDMNLSNDKQTGSVTIQAIPTPVWTQKADVPSLAVRKYVSAGGAMTSVGSSVYSFRGNSSTEFYKYDGSWSQMASAPGAVTAGGALCYDGSNVIYATQGGKTAFWAYSISTNIWTSKAAIPVTVKAGTGLVYYNGKVFLLAGGQKVNKPNFYSYNPATNTWTQLTYAPTPDNVAYSSGSCLAELNGLVYALKGSGSDNYLFAYNPATNNWSAQSSLPLVHPYLGISAKVGDGGAMTSTGTEIYAIKGNGYCDFWKYASGIWTALDTIPRLNSKSVPKAGAALGYANAKVYLQKGNNLPEFWQYDPSLATMLKLNAMTNVSITSNNQSIQVFKLDAIPNPALNNTVIHYAVPQAQFVSIKLYNASGQLVRVLQDSYHESGNYTLNIANVANGIYFLKYTDGTNKSELKLIIQ